MTGADEVNVTYAGRKIAAKVERNDNGVAIQLVEPLNVSKGEVLKVMLR